MELAHICVRQQHLHILRVQRSHCSFTYSIYEHTNVTKENVPIKLTTWIFKFDINKAAYTKNTKCFKKHHIAIKTYVNNLMYIDIVSKTLQIDANLLARHCKQQNLQGKYN